MKEAEFEETWNKKRVGIAIAVFLLVISGLIYFSKQNLSSKISSHPQEAKVLSASDRNIENTISDQIDSIKKAALNIDVGEIASSSPQIQKLIQDLKSLQDYPRNQVKDTCFSICKGL